jgi:hypothetical protein
MQRPWPLAREAGGHYPSDRMDRVLTVNQRPLATGVRFPPGGPLKGLRPDEEQGLVAPLQNPPLASRAARCCSGLLIRRGSTQGSIPWRGTNGEHSRCISGRGGKNPQPRTMRFGVEALSARGQVARQQAATLSTAVRVRPRCPSGVYQNWHMGCVQTAESVGSTPTTPTKPSYRIGTGPRLKPAGNEGSSPSEGTNRVM